MTFFGEDAVTAGRYAEGFGGRRGREGDPRIIDETIPADARILDITGYDGVRMLADLPAPGRMSSAIVGGARQDLNDLALPGGAILGRPSQASLNLWQLSKVAGPNDAAGIRRDIVDALAARGYDGIRFTDDQHPTIALFDTATKARRASAAMDADFPVASISEDVAPGAIVIDPGDIASAPQMGRSRPAMERPSADEIAAMAGRVEPGDVLPRPRSEVGTLDEAAKIDDGQYRPVTAPDERDVLPRYQLPGSDRTRRNPLDLAAWLRTQGGVRDQGGELSGMGITNARRDLSLAGDVGLPRLVNSKGMTLDEAADAAWRAGYFPNSPKRPTIAEFLDALGETYRGGPGRVFHPDDYEAVDAYHAARGQREAVEQAQAEGRPFYEDRGEPVELDDLEANRPPATAYEDLPDLASRAGNIDVSKLESRGDIVRAIFDVHRTMGGFDAARRGKISHIETEALASDLRMTADDLLKRRQGQAVNAEQALAARSILAKSADEVVVLARKAKDSETEADLAAFRAAWIKHVAIQEQVAGLTAEAGRTLSQFRAMAKSKLPVGRIHQLQIDKAGGPDALKDAAQAILDASATPGGLNQATRLLLKPKLKDKLVELYFNSLLSGPQTHAVNVLSNAITAGLQIPEHIAAAGIGSLRTVAGKRGENVDRVLASEVGARALGLLQGAKDGLRAFACTARTGIVPDHVSKVEAQSEAAISGFKGEIIRTPTRMLSAEDELFKAIARRMELSGLAVRKATSEGLKGAALRQRVDMLAANPTNDMVEQSLDYARYLTFQRSLGEIGQTVSSLTNKAPALKLIIPFVRTPTNILKFAAERSPAAPILREWRSDFAAGGARRDLAVAKMALGTGLGMTAVQWAEHGYITGAVPRTGKRAPSCLPMAGNLTVLSWATATTAISGLIRSPRRWAWRPIWSRRRTI